jgi:carbamoyl-phosphate synthase large subunit
LRKSPPKLAVGYTLDEIPNDITKKLRRVSSRRLITSSRKFPKWAFEKFPGAEDVLGTQMKSVGEVMAIGRTFKKVYSKASLARSRQTALRLENVPDHVLHSEAGASEFAAIFLYYLRFAERLFDSGNSPSDEN